MYGTYVDEYVFTVRKSVNDETTVCDGCVSSVEGTKCTFVAKPPKFKIEFEAC